MSASSTSVVSTTSSETVSPQIVSTLTTTASESSTKDPTPTSTTLTPTPSSSSSISSSTSSTRSTISSSPETTPTQSPSNSVGGSSIKPKLPQQRQQQQPQSEQQQPQIQQQNLVQQPPPPTPPSAVSLTAAKSGVVLPVGGSSSSSQSSSNSDSSNFGSTTTSSGTSGVYEPPTTIGAGGSASSSTSPVIPIVATVICVLFVGIVGMFVYKKRAARQQKSALAAATGDNDMVLPYAFSDNPTGGNLKLEKENKLMMMAAKSSTHPPSIDNSDNSAPPALAPIVNQYAFEPTRESIDYIRYASVYTQNPVVADNALVASSGTVTQHKWTAPSTPSSKNASMIEDSSAGQEHRDSMMSEFEVSPKAASSEMASKRDKYRSIYSNYSVEGSNGGDQQQLDHAPPNSSSRHQSTVSMSTRKFISPLARSAWTSSEEEENNNSKHFSVGGDGEVNVRYSNVTKRDSWMTEGSVSSSPTIQLKKMTKSFFIYN